MSNSSIFSSDYSRYLTFIACVFLALSVWLVSAFAFLPGPTPTRDEHLWSGTLRLEKNAIANSEEGPRILLYGGSDAAFAFSGRQMTKLTGIPSFNMGTYAGNGIGLLLNDAMNFARRGDIVVICLVPQQPFNANAFVTRDAKSVDQWIGRNYFRTGSIREKIALLGHAEILDFLPLRPRPPRINREVGYWKYPVDEYGDIPPVFSTEESRKSYLDVIAKGADIENGYRPPRHRPDWSIASFLKKPRRAHPSFEPVIAEYLKRAQDAIESKGAKVFFTFSASPAANNPNVVKALTAVVGVKNYVAGAEKLDPDLMFDTFFHLNVKGRAKATVALTRSLCKAIVCNKAAAGTAI